MVRGTKRMSGVIAAGVISVAALAAAALGTGVAGAASPTTAREISTAQDSQHGTFLVADTTVYTLDLDVKSCTAKCAKAWRAVVLPEGVKKASAGSGVDAQKLGTVKTPDGARQVTYDGDPLYWFTKDTAPGDVKGAVSDKWGTGALVVTEAVGGGTDVGTGGVAF